MIASRPASSSTQASRKRFQLQPGVLPRLAVDRDGVIRLITPPARRLLEYDDEQRVDDYFFSIVHGKHLRQIMSDVAAMVRYGKSSATWLARLRTGKRRWRWYRLSAQNHLDGPDEAIVVTLSDVHRW